MRARPDILPHLIAHRMKRWLDIARCPIMDAKVPTWKARRNYRALVRKYPEIAERLGYSEAMSYPSPLHGIQQQEPPALPKDGNVPARDDKHPEPPESPAVADNSALGQATENQPAPPRATGAPRRLWSLEDEVL
jgi:hypothetical protein